MVWQKDGALIVFDLVATLTDAGPRYVRAFQEACLAAGFPAPPDDDIAAMLGEKTLSEIIDHFIGPLPEDQKSHFMTECNGTCDAMLSRPDWKETLYPHVREAIETLTLQGMRLGIYTGTRESALQDQMKYHDIERFFDPRLIRGKDNIRDAGRKSADLKQDMLRDIVGCFHALPGRGNAAVIVIGDSPADADAAFKAGLAFIGFAVDDKKRQRLEQAGVRTIITDFGMLPDLIARMKSPPVNDNAPHGGPVRSHRPRP